MGVVCHMIGTSIRTYYRVLEAVKIKIECYRKGSPPTRREVYRKPAAYRRVFSTRYYSGFYLEAGSSQIIPYIPKPLV